MIRRKYLSINGLLTIYKRSFDNLEQSLSLDLTLGKFSDGVCRISVARRIQIDDIPAYSISGTRRNMANSKCEVDFWRGNVSRCGLNLRLPGLFHIDIEQKQPPAGVRVHHRFNAMEGVVCFEERKQ